MVCIITKSCDSSSSQSKVKEGEGSFTPYPNPKTRCKKPTQNRVKCTSANKKTSISLLNILLPLNTAILALVEEIEFLRL